jgi:hypothetical protein
MKLAQILHLKLCLLLAAFACFSLAAKAETAHGLSKLRPRQGFFPVTGITENGVHPRREINDLDGIQLTLFVLGLQRMQQKNQTDALSYYQIAGKFGTYSRLIVLLMHCVRNSWSALCFLGRC